MAIARVRSRRREDDPAAGAEIRFPKLRGGGPRRLGRSLKGRVPPRCPRRTRFSGPIGCRGIVALAVGRPARGARQGLGTQRTA